MGRNRLRIGWGRALIAAMLTVTALLLPAAARARVTKTCLTGNAPEVAGDAAAIRGVRTVVDAACVCSDFDGSKGKSHKAYVACARKAVAAEATAGHLRTQCKATVTSFYAQSICGRNPALHTQPCVKISSKTGKVTCAIKPTTKKDGTTPSPACTDKPGVYQQLPCDAANADWTTCIDAADSNGDLKIGAGPGGTDTGACNCHSGFLDCNGQAADGCEVDPATDAGHCGSCANVCSPNNATVACTNSTCTIAQCTAGYINLDGVAADGCEYACPNRSAIDSCNGKDDDCDGVVDNIHGSAAGSACDLQQDVHNCGAAGNDCLAGAVHANWSCQSGVCVFGGCQAGYYDLDGDKKCEYPCVFVSAQEACNGVDDNCNGQIDEGLTSPSPAQVCGVSPAASAPECTTQVTVSCVNGGWHCTFPAGVCNPTCAQAAEVCDLLDNNCNGLLNENVSGYGQPCASDDGQPVSHGPCRTTGTYVCNGQNATACSAVKDLSKAGPEIADGIDNDCDGLVDETFNNKGANALYFVKPAVTQFAPNLWIYSYEASRTNATSASAGSGNAYWSSAPSGATLDGTRPASLPNKIPWFNIYGPEAEQACSNVGGHLCTTSEWQTACQAAAACTWGYAGANGACSQPADAGKYCNLGSTFDFDQNPANGDQDNVLPTASPALAACYADWAGAGQVFDLTGNVRELTKTASNQYTGMGGSFFSLSEAGAACTATTFAVDGSFAFQDSGFRCCFNADPRQ